MATIRTVTEGKRGCGFRKKGGMYLMSGALSVPCGRLPFALTVCPCCGAGIKPTRGWTWVDGDALVKQAPDCSVDVPETICRGCPLRSNGEKFGKVGLLWIGEAFYKTPGDWTAEAHRMGVSRRLPQIPRGLKIGDTWVFVAHRKAVPAPDDALPSDAGKFSPGVFHVFKPDRIEYVVKGTETEEELDALEKRGLDLVKVVNPQSELVWDGKGGEQ